MPTATTALMRTAANMQCAVLAEASHEELAVRVAATASSSPMPLAPEIPPVGTRRRKVTARSKLTACLADGLLGDPVYRLHPVRLLGAWSLKWEKILFAGGLNGYLGGLIHWAFVVGVALLIWWTMHRLLAIRHPWGGLGLGCLHRLQPTLPAGPVGARSPGPDQPG